MIAWPFDNIRIFGSLQAGFPDNLLRTEMDQGPSKTRPRSKMASHPVGFSKVMTFSEFALLRTFHKDTLAFGSLQFSVRSPETREPIVVKFSDQPDGVEIGTDRMKVDLAFEVMP